MESRVQDVTQYYAKFQNILPEKLMTEVCWFSFQFLFIFPSHFSTL